MAASVIWVHICLSLALVGVLDFGCLGCFEGACPSSRAVSFFVLIDVLHHRKAC